MAFFTEAQLMKAREMDLLTYLKTYEPAELVHVSGNEYCTREHDSLKISNGKWMWWSQGFGGYGALDYLVKVKGEPFTEAVKKVLGVEAERPPIISSTTPSISSKKLLLPDESPYTEEITKYLMGRGIDWGIIENCIREHLLYESLPHHNCIFVGYDKEGAARYAAFRATGKERILGEAAGSDKRYSFKTGRPGGMLHIFESAIDLLSYATLVKVRGGDWQADPMLSLGGVFVPKGPDKGKLPIALAAYLEEYPETKAIALHLDNDHAGKSATIRLKENLKDRFQATDETPLFGKDVNDELVFLLGQSRKERYEYGR